MTHELFDLVTKEVTQFYKSRSTTRIGTSLSHKELRSLANSELPKNGETPEKAIHTLISSVENALLHSISPRYYGFVIGGTTPVSIAADWLTSAWDQNAQVYNTSPAAAIIEDIVTTWILDLLKLPLNAGIGYVTGAQMANFVGLSVARNSVLTDHSWDIDAKGLQNAPYINIICGECCHGTIKSAIRMMGLGTDNIITIPADSEGRIRIAPLHAVLRNCEGPTILCLQAGNVNTGAFDNFKEIIDYANAQKVWVHVDGAFGLWARATPHLRHLTDGVQKADSWSVDAHKWLNVPYDSGMVIVRNAELHTQLKTARCAYAGEHDENHRDGSTWVPENSRRARAFVLYAALRSMGREGLARLIADNCEMAKKFEGALKKIPAIHVLNKVVLNQVLFRLEPPSVIDLDAFNTAVADRLQRSSTCWIGTTEWKGVTALRISISNHATQEQDVTMTVDSLKTEIDEELKTLEKNARAKRDK